MHHRLALLLSLLVVHSVAGAEQDRVQALYSMDNDTISVLMNDVRFPLDDFDFPAGTTHINNLYLGFYDGATGYYFSDFVQGGNSSLVLLGEVVESGSAPNQSIEMSFADAAPPSRFTIDVLVEMLGDGTHALRWTATITNLLPGQPLNATKFYVFTDVAITASEGGDLSAYDVDSGIFYTYDQTNTPHTWFGCHANGPYELHYAGLPYVGPVGLAPFHEALVTGSNLSDVVNNTPEDQVAGWNWDLGTIDDVVIVGFAVGAHNDLPSLVLALENALPADPSIFADGFESGDLSAWTSSAGSSSQNED